ncbi:MAG: hypothetical protein QOF68_2226 [Gaiellales bacterium]|nr:hypothetical protein [Gaiellales bacterium]
MVTIVVFTGIVLGISALTGGFSYEPGNCFLQKDPDYVGQCDDYTDRFIAFAAKSKADCEPDRSYFEHDDKGWCVEPQIAVGVCAIAPARWKRGESADVWVDCQNPNANWKFVSKTSYDDDCKGPYEELPDTGRNLTNYFCAERI